MTLYEIISIVISFLSLLATILVSFVVYFIGKKADEKKYQLEIEHQARDFIIKQGDENIRYLPLCALSSACNRNHKHIRSIYNAFDALPDSVQKEVLKQTGYHFHMVKGNEWIVESLKEIQNFIDKYDLGKSFLDGDKDYFLEAFEKFPENSVSEFIVYENKYDNLFEQSDNKMKEEIEKISFSNYIECYCKNFIFCHDIEKYDKSKVVKPLDYLAYVENFDSCSETNLCFWIMEMLSEIAYYVIRNRHDNNLVHYDEWEIPFAGTELIETFEDKYYATLVDLYYLHIDLIQTKNEK